MPAPFNNNTLTHSSGRRNESDEVLRVAVVSRRLAHYRVPFYEALRERHPNIRLHFYCGERDSTSGTSGISLSEMDPDYVRRGKTIRLPLTRAGVLVHPGHIIKIIKERYDVVVCEGTLALATGILLALMRRLLGAPTFFWLKGWPDQSTRNSVRKRLNRLFLRLVHRYLVYGQSSAQQLKSLGVPADRIHVMQNTVDVGELLYPPSSLDDPAENQHIREVIASRRPFIFNIGRLIHVKRVLDLVEAHARLSSDPAIKMDLVIAGTGPELDRLQALVRERGQKGVHFVGGISDQDANRLFRAATLCVFPGAVGLSLNQAMAAGRASICADEPGPDSELIVNKMNGLRFPPGDVTALIQALRALAGNNALREQLGRQARQTILEKATIEKMADSFAQAVRQAARAGRTSEAAKTL